MSSAPPPDAPRVPADAPDDPQAPARGMAAVLTEQQFSVAEAVGGWRGVAESVLPTLVFVVVFVIGRELKDAAIAAVAVSAIALVLRLIQRQGISTALGGLLGVGIGAIWAVRSGQGTDFYLPGFIINAVTLAVLVVSILARQPLVGVVAGLVDQRVASWRADPDAVRTYRAATWLLASLYAAKLAVQGVLLAMGAVAALGIAKIVMGLPLFALVMWLIWLMHRALLARQAGTDTVRGR